jgi:protein-serine/threonine kinase
MLTFLKRHKTTFSFPSKPAVSRRCQDLIRSIIQEKDHRLCSKRYKNKDHVSGTRRNQDYAGRCVYPDDAEEIKAHKWFRDIQWDRIHTMTPPFVPNIKSTDDTHYFDEEDSISDFSASVAHSQPTTEEIADALKRFNRELQILATGFIERPYDSIRLRKVEKEIDAFNVSDEQKGNLKEFVKRYGRKEKKRPRDRLLRDRELASKVLELRKRGAFLGYTYRRIRQGRVSLSKGAVSGVGGGVVVSNTGKRNGWHRARLSIH